METFVDLHLFLFHFPRLITTIFNLFLNQITQTMQIPLSYAEDIIGIGGANIAYIRRTSGAILTVQESRGLPDEITVEIKGTSSQVQAAQQLIQVKEFSIILYLDKIASSPNDGCFIFHQVYITKFPCQPQWLIWDGILLPLHPLPPGLRGPSKDGLVIRELMFATFL